MFYPLVPVCISTLAFLLASASFRCCCIGSAHLVVEALVVSLRPCLFLLQGNLSARRRALVMMAYDVLDKDGSGEVRRDDIESAYDVTHNPDVITGKKTPAEAITDFMAQWETGKVDGIISRDEFLDYYKGAWAGLALPPLLLCCLRLC